MGMVLGAWGLGRSLVLGFPFSSGRDSNSKTLRMASAMLEAAAAAKDQPCDS